MGSPPGLDDSSMWPCRFVQLWVVASDKQGNRGSLGKRDVILSRHAVLVKLPAHFSRPFTSHGFYAERLGCF